MTGAHVDDRTAALRHATSVWISTARIRQDPR